MTAGRPKLYEGVTCSREGCDRPAKTRGLCNNHIVTYYNRQRGISELTPSIVDIPKAVLLYEAGYSYAQIGQVFGVGREWIRQKLAGHVTPRKSWGQPKSADNSEHIPEFDKTTHRRCWECKQIKERSEFHKSRQRGSDGNAHICKICKVERAKKGNAAARRSKKNAAAFAAKWPSQ